jgi:hypothetical protein
MSYCWKCILKVGVEESIVNAPLVSHTIKTQITQKVRLDLSRWSVISVTRGAFTIDSPTPTLRINLNNTRYFYRRNLHVYKGGSMLILELVTSTFVKVNLIFGVFEETCYMSRWPMACVFQQYIIRFYDQYCNYRAQFWLLSS